jgi:PadR family transcriptional regulator PadR
MLTLSALMPPLSPLGEFEVVVLLAVLHNGSEAYGSTIRQAIEARTGRPVSRGAVYVTLDRLEDKGLLRSSLGEALAERGGRPRRYHRLTPRGLKALRSSLDRLTRMRVGLEPLLEKP